MSDFDFLGLEAVIEQATATLPGDAVTGTDPEAIIAELGFKLGRYRGMWDNFKAEFQRMKLETTVS